MDENPTPVSGIGRRSLVGLAYVAAGGLALLVAELPVDTPEWLCGVWGCFPPLQALAALHLLWCIVAAATVHWLASRNAGDIRIEGMLLILLSGVAIFWFVGRDLLDWVSLVSAEYAAYRPRRIGYTLATQSNLPLIPILVAGMVCYQIGRRRAGEKSKSVHSVPKNNTTDSLAEAGR